MNLVADLLLGVDTGTSSVKVGLVDRYGHLVGLGRADHRNMSPHPGWAECDPEKWWFGMRRALTAACNQAGVAPSRVAAVGLSTLFPAVTLIDHCGCAMHPAILYHDRRSNNQVKRIEEILSRNEYETLIGNVLTPGTCAVTSLAWLRDERPETYLAASILGFANTFLGGRLTGRFGVDPSTVSLSGLVDIKTPWQWSREICEKLDIDYDRLPKILGAQQVVGTVTSEVASKTGLQVGTPVVCGCGDAVASAFAVGATDDDVLLTTGSTNCVSVILSSPILDRRWINCAYIPRGKWMAIGTMSSAGVAVNWFAKEVLGKGGAEGLRRMTDLAAGSPPGANGLVFLPYLLGERTPVWDPNARGIFFGITNATQRKDLSRAVFEGIAMGIRHILASLEENLGRKVEQVRVVGGMTRNSLWTQIAADVLQRRLSIVECVDASALGAALLAGIAAGWYYSFRKAEGIARARCHWKIVLPRTEFTNLYSERYAVYKKLYPAIKHLL